MRQGKNLLIAALVGLSMSTLIACGNDSNNGGGGGSVPVATPAGTYIIDYNVNNCPTGRRTYVHKYDYCTQLLNDSLNNHCARTERERAYHDHGCSTITNNSNYTNWNPNTNNITGSSVSSDLEISIYNMRITIPKGDKLDLAGDYPYQTLPWSTTKKKRTMKVYGALDLSTSGSALWGLVEYTRSKVYYFCESPKVTYTSKETFCAVLEDDKAMGGCGQHDRKRLFEHYDCGVFSPTNNLFSYKLSAGLAEVKKTVKTKDEYCDALDADSDKANETISELAVEIYDRDCLGEDY